MPAHEPAKRPDHEREQIEHDEREHDSGTRCQPNPVVDRRLVAGDEPQPAAEHTDCDRNCRQKHQPVGQQAGRRRRDDEKGDDENRPDGLDRGDDDDRDDEVEGEVQQADAVAHRPRRLRVERP